MADAASAEFAAQLARRWSKHQKKPNDSIAETVSDPVFHTAMVRLDAYRAWVAAAVSDEELELIRLRLQRQHVLGTDRFRAMIEVQLRRRAGPAKMGRPSSQGQR